MNLLKPLLSYGWLAATQYRFIDGHGATRRKLLIITIPLQLAGPQAFLPSGLKRNKPRTSTPVHVIRGLKPSPKPKTF